MHLVALWLLVFGGLTMTGAGFVIADRVPYYAPSRTRVIVGLSIPGILVTLFAIGLMLHDVRWRILLMIVLIVATIEAVSRGRIGVVAGIRGQVSTLHFFADQLSPAPIPPAIPARTSPPVPNCKNESGALF